MKLLFFVQMLKEDDTIRGFILNWVRALAKEVEQLTVISQETHVFDIEKNIKVISLGKESGVSKYRQALSLQSILYKEFSQHQVDAILTHMTPIYSVAVAPLAGLFGVPIFTWYTHGHVSPALRLADQLSQRCFTASESSYRLSSSKRCVVGHGIDLNHFGNNPAHLTSQTGALKIVTASRISPSKNLHLLLQSLRNVTSEWSLDIAGEAPMSSQKPYEESIRKLADELGPRVTWHGPISYQKMPEFLKKGDVYINLSSTNSLDKGVFEAIASGLTVLTSNEAFWDFLEGTREQTFITTHEVSHIAEKIETLLKTSRKSLQESQAYLLERVRSSHNLENLAKVLVEKMEPLH